VDDWIDQALGDGLIEAGEPQAVTDASASHRWYVRLRGEEKEAITLWLTLRQRTLVHEAHFMPAPEANLAEVLAYLMRRNRHLYGAAFCLGPEDAVYLVGKVPAGTVDEAELDRIAGSSLRYVDDHFPTAMELGFPGLYRRRRRVR
jgi:hypothetical protein